MVEVLQDVQDFHGLAGWLNIAMTVNNIEDKCDRFSLSYHKCCMRKLVQHYCQNSDLKQTKFDIADALKKMKYTRQANKLLEIDIAPGNQDCFSPVSSGALLQYAKYLKDRYATYQSSIPDKLPFTLGKEFVKLSLVKNNTNSKRKPNHYIHLKSSGNVEQILEEAEEIMELKDIVKEEDTRLIVIEGEPGIGKSTLALELCHQWQKGSLLQQFSLVLLLKLREERVHAATTIWDLFYHDDDDLRDEVVEEVNDKAGKDVLFIFDGFDELPDATTETSLVMDIISFNHLHMATKIVTTRPQSTKLQKYLETHKSERIEIVGFTRESIQKAASNVLDDTDDFSSYLLAHPVIEIMMRNPLTCAIVLNTYKYRESDRPIPHTRTQLYTELTISLVSGYLNEIGEHELAESLPEKLEDFPKKLYSQLLCVGELAYTGTILGHKEIFEKLPDNCSGLGLLIEHRSLLRVTETVKYNFFHKTLQEYMSAFYISQLGVEKQTEFIMQQQTISRIFAAVRPDMFEVAKFLAGLTKMEAVGWDMFSDPMCFTSECHLVISCFYEAHTVEKCTIFQQVEKVEFGGILTEYELYALGFTISVCDKSWDLYLPKTTVSGLKILSNGLKHNQPAKGTIRSLNFTSSYNIMNEGEHLLQIPQYILREVKFLSLGSCNLNRKGFKNLALSIPKLQSLIALNVSHNPGGPGSLAHLMHSLETHKNLQFLSMYMVDIGMQDISVVSDFIETLKSLKYLLVGENFSLKRTHESSNIDTQLENTIKSLSSSLVDAEDIATYMITNVTILEVIDILNFEMVSTVVFELPPIQQGIKTIVIWHLQVDDIPSKKVRILEFVKNITHYS